MVGAIRLANGLLHYALMAAANEATHNTRHDERPNEVTATIASQSTCDARTINHITHTLPQLCLTRVWTSTTPGYNGTTASATTAPHVSSGESINLDAITSAPSMNGSISGYHSAPTVAETEGEAVEEAETESRTDAAGSMETEGGSFMSFEDWKEMMLRQTGQDPQDLRLRRATGSQDDRRVPPEIGDFGLGEEGEISLDFENYLNQANRDSYQVGRNTVERTSGDDANDGVLYEGDTRSLHRNKDAGKTCKERFSYSSFDAGATVLKTGRGTKNAKAILIENKDSYMLLECGADTKYVIVELSDDILIDTVVLANFEFFSSMIRQFRVSVSDRYPVKIDRWKEVGTFEARNSRDIQAFLVENPQIWAKYVRIEFQTHYGNEYYCPVSLLRIHGSRMLDSWKDIDGGGEEELSIDEVEAGAEQGPVDETPVPSIDIGSVEDVIRGSSEPELDVTPWSVAPLARALDVCPQAKPSAEAFATMLKESTAEHHEHPPPHQSSTSDAALSASSPTTIPDSSSTSHALPPTANVTGSHDTASRETAKVVDSSTTGAATDNTPSVDSSSPPTKASTSGSAGSRVRGSGTMGAPAASPTVQEGFFNAITKRLHQAETNLTLTMQYLEDHSRYVQESLQKAEEKQLSKVTSFLDNLNQTVLAELRGMRDQYDQIWQSTVFALEIQREQADRDIVALSSRLNLLADEVVFQKRMAIVQAILLLCCLFLVIFSRGVPIPYLAPLLDPAGAAGVPGAMPTPGDLSQRALYTSQSRQDEAEEHHHDKGWPTERNHESVIPNDSHCRGSSMTTRLTRLSPPLTPSFEAHNSTAADPTTDCELDELLLRRLTTYHPHANQSRKPLPALPEHPSPERPSSS